MSFYIYGTGIRGKGALLYLNKKVDAFIVSEKMVFENKVILKGREYPIYSINEIMPTEDDICLLATQYLNEIIPLAHDKKWKIETLKDYEWYIAINLLKLYELDVDVDKKLLNFKDFKIPNLFNMKDVQPNIMESWVREMADLTYPYIGYKGLIGEGLYEYYDVYVESEDYVIDCGANLGLFSAMASQKGAKVWACEPLKKCSNYIEHINKECDVDITIVNKCIADYTGVTDFTETEENIGASSMSKSENGINYKIEVTTIDELVNEYEIPKVDFIKADIEGAERLMLKGATETIRKFSPKLSLCTYHLYDDVQVLTDIIKEINPNYIIKYAWQKLYAWCPKDV